MSVIKKLASQTAIYGLSSMLGRFINFLLVIPHTAYLKTVGDYGDITAIFASMAFCNIILTYGMETTYFSFIRRGHLPEKIFAISQKSLFITTTVFALLVIVFPHECSDILGFPGRLDFVYACLIFLVFDTLSVMPFARLRQEERPLKFAFVKLVNILVNVSLNLLLLIHPPGFLDGYSPVTLILVANAVASIVSFLLLSPSVFKIDYQFELSVFRQMVDYAWPLIFVGLAGIVNETLDRNLIIRLLPSAEGSYQNGIYGAYYKLTMVMTMFVQAYKFAAEPFFFKQADNSDSRQVYADILYWFTGICSLIFLACVLFSEELARLFIHNESFFKDKNGLYIVPILLLANLFLGIYYNISVWYRLTNNTKIGSMIAIGGALITITGNIIFIPKYGFVACAWLTLVVYFLMCIAALVLGNHYFKVPYAYVKLGALILLSIVLWQLYRLLDCHISAIWLSVCTKIMVMALLMLIIWLLHPKGKKA